MEIIKKSFMFFLENFGEASGLAPSMTCVGVPLARHTNLRIILYLPPQLTDGDGSI